jgi:hypothetical protein
MNYVPPSRLLSPFGANLSDFMERYIGQVLRDFKASLEGKGQEGVRPATRVAGERVGPAAMTKSEAKRATGTFGAPNKSAESVDKLGTRPNPVEYTAPPEAKR